MNTQSPRIVRATISLAALIALGFTNISAGSPDAGAALYKTKCAACHGADGKGATAVGKADSIRALGSPECKVRAMLS